jgi:CysZ protein
LLEEIIIAFQSYVRAHHLIVKNKLWKWILIPGIIYAIMFGLGIYLFWQSSAHVIDYFFSRTGLKIWLQKEQDSWLRFIFIFGQVILQLILMLLYFSWFKYLFLIIGSPLFAWLSEKTEALLHNEKRPFSLKKFLKDVLRGIRIALRNTLWQTVYTISILILSLIPIVGWATPVLAIFVECFYFGFSMLDYTSTRKGLSAAESIDFIGRNKGLATGNGMVFYLMHAIPVAGWIFAPGYAVIAATLSLQDKKN